MRSLMWSRTAGHFVLVDVPTNICFWTGDGSAACGLEFGGRRRGFYPLLAISGREYVPKCAHRPIVRDLAVRAMPSSFLPLCISVLTCRFLPVGAAAATREPRSWH